MTLSDLKRLDLFAGCIALCVFFSFLRAQEKLKYSQSATIVSDYDPQQISKIGFLDTLSSDSLFLLKTQSDVPLYYFKDITKDVCFDGECRILTITVFWNITGRYLGFELPHGEFLSKYDHEPFSNDEYLRLNDLLADPNLPLGQISFEKLIEVPASVSDSIDGVSGATTATVAQMVVEGAAYTTYTLWNIVHGTTQDYVIHLSEGWLTSDLIDLILKSPDINDRIWALKRIPHQTVLTSELRTSLLEIIAGSDFFLAYSAINAIRVSHLHDASLQMGLYSIYKDADHSIQRMIIDKLIMAPNLSIEVANSFRMLLPKLNGQQLGGILKLYSKHGIHNAETYKAIAHILKNENKFISRKAYDFLKKSDISEKEILELLSEYEKGA